MGKGVVMRIVKARQCAGIWTEPGPFQGKRCTETRNLVHCNSVLDPGCDNYYCLWAHWSNHWPEHEEGSNNGPESVRE